MILPSPEDAHDRAPVNGAGADEASGLPVGDFDVPSAPHPTARVPFPYQSIPGPLRLALSRWFLGGADPAARAPAVAFAVDDAGPAWGAALSAEAWPGGARAALGLSHDVDTPRGLERLPDLLEVEEELGVRSTIFVPGEVLALRPDRVRAWQERGWEFGLHGAVHDQRLPSLEGPARDERLHRIGEVAGGLGLEGFRAPSLWIRRRDLTDLASVFRYDSSVPSYRPPGRLGPARGARTCRPFRLGRLWVLPVSLPLDDDLLREGGSRRSFPDRWLDVIAAVGSRGGLATYVDHVEPHLSGNRAGRRAYRELVTRARDDRGLWITHLAAVVDRLEAREAPRSLSRR